MANTPKLISLAPYSFDEAVRKILTAKPEPKTEKPKAKRRTPKKLSKSKSRQSATT